MSESTLNPTFLDLPAGHLFVFVGYADYECKKIGEVEYRRVDADLRSFDAARAGMMAAPVTCRHFQVFEYDLGEWKWFGSYTDEDQAIDDLNSERVMLEVPCLMDSEAAEARGKDYIRKLTERTARRQSKVRLSKEQVTEESGS